MEKEMIELIRNIQDEKKEKGRVPATALFIADIMPGVKKMAMETLVKLVKNKQVKWSRTINDDSFRISKDGQ